MPAGFAIFPASEVKRPIHLSARNKLYLGVICFVAGLGGLLFGFDTAVISGTIVFLKSQYQLTPVLEGFVVSSGLIGCIIGSVAAGPTSDRFGRKYVLLVSGMLMVICSVGCALSGVHGIIGYRLLGGLGVGVASMVSPLYIAEVTPSNVRGRMVSLYQFSIALGVLGAFASNALLLHLVGTMRSIATAGVWKMVFVDEVWRSMFGAMLIPSSLFSTLLFFVPESPRWLVKQGVFDRAEATLAKVGGAGLAGDEMQEIREAVAAESSSMAQLFTPRLRRALWLGLLLPLFSQISGINVIIYYATCIFEQTGVGRGSSLGMQVIIGSIGLLGVIISMWKVDKFGRRPMLLFGTGATTLTLILLGATYHTGTGGNLILLVLCCLYVGIFNAAFAPVMWVVLSEIFPTRIRGRAMSIGTTSMWVGCTLVAQTFPWLQDKLGMTGSFFLYACLLGPSVPFLWKVLPETKGRTLEEIERSWQFS